jgi:hypothetical protein
MAAIDVLYAIVLNTKEIVKSAKTLTDQNTDFPALRTKLDEAVAALDAAEAP